MAFTYRHGGCIDDYTVKREWGFTGKEDAGKAKLEVGKKLLTQLIEEEGVTGIAVKSFSGFLGLREGSLTADSGRFFYNNAMISAGVEGKGLYIRCGAKHRASPTKEGTYSEMYVTIVPSDEQSRRASILDIIRRMSEYLNQYELRPELQPQSVKRLVPETAR